MALPRKLKTARMTDATIGSTIDDAAHTADVGGIGSLESALCDIFGFTIDSDITASPFSLNNAGQITKALVAQRAAGPVGWRMRDTTTGNEVRIAVSGTNFVIDENTGTEGTPIWTNRFSMAVATGALTGALATASRMGLCPTGSGAATDFLDGTLNWSAPGASTPPSCRVRHSANTSCSSGSTVSISFDTEDWDTDAMHSTVTNTSRVTCVETGKYLVIGNVSFASNSTGTRIAQILKNGTTLYGRTAVLAASGANTALDVRALVDLTAGDYVQLQVLQNSGSAINCLAAANYSPVLSVIKVG